MQIPEWRDARQAPERMWLLICQTGEWRPGIGYAPAIAYRVGDNWFEDENEEAEGTGWLMSDVGWYTVPPAHPTGLPWPSGCKG